MAGNENNDRSDNTFPRHQSTFIRIGNVNFKVSNIKEFGTATESRKYNPSLSEAVENLTDRLTGFGFMSDVRRHSGENISYLYVKTYQNENYRFYANEINIDEAMKRLNAL